MRNENPIVIDANVFLRFLVESSSSETQKLSETARRLFHLAAMGDLHVTSNAAVIAEVVFILHSKKHYDRPRAEVADRLGRILDLQTFVLREKHQILHALNRWQETPGLSFVDCLVVEQSGETNAQLVSFDRRVQRAASDRLWADPIDE